MSMTPLAARLRDFSVTPLSRPEAVGKRTPAHGPTETEIQQLLSDAYARGQNAARSQVADEIEKRIAETRAAYEANHRTALASLEQETLSNIGNSLAKRVDLELAAIEQRLSTRIAAILLPFVSAAIARAAAEEAARCLGLFEIPGSTKIHLRGPEALVTAVQAAALPGRQFEVEVVDQVELSVSIDETTIETRLAVWQKQLNGDVS